MRTVLSAAVAMLVVVGSVFADNERVVRGRVVDASGKPAAGVDVSTFWRANGPPTDADGKPYDLQTPQGQTRYWSNEGKMFPLGGKPVKTAPDGRFTMTIRDDLHQLMAMDAPRRTGALAILPAADAGEVELRLAPLTRIHGTIRGPRADERPEWTHVYLLVPDDPARPLDFTRLGDCGSNEARFEMSLPPGRYLLDPTWVTDADVCLTRDPLEIILTGQTREIDLGVLRVAPSGPTLSTRVNESKAANRWRDFTEHYGEAPPPWNAVDARGVKKDVQIGDFKGKWVLIYFWGMSCAPCLRDGIPNLTKFYEDHKPQRDRFEILSICIDEGGKLKSIADLDGKLEPIVKNIWKKPIPFPILLDPTFKTWERFGLPGMGTVILIDPQGKLVEGDETVLAEKLK